MIIMITGGNSSNGDNNDDGGDGSTIYIEVKIRKPNAINKLLPVLVSKCVQ